MTLTAADIMTRKVITARPDDTVARIARLLSDHEISALPICDQDGSLLGIVSEGDLIRPYGRDNISKRAWWVALLAEGTDLAPSFMECLRVENHPVSALMTGPVIAASPETPVADLADLLARHHIKRLPILSEGKLVGIVSRADVVRTIARTPDAIAEAL
jgi:CBS domain-containing protein